MFKTFLFTGYHFCIVFSLFVITFITVCNAYDKWAYVEEESEINKPEVITTEV